MNECHQERWSFLVFLRKDSLWLMAGIYPAGAVFVGRVTHAGPVSVDMETGADSVVPDTGGLRLIAIFPIQVFSGIPTFPRSQCSRRFPQYAEFLTFLTLDRGVSRLPVNSRNMLSKEVGLAT